MNQENFLDEDVVALLERLSAERGVPVRELANRAIRDQLGHVPEQKRALAPFHTRPLNLGKQLVDNFDDVAEVLAKAEGENYH